MHNEKIIKYHQRFIFITIIFLNKNQVVKFP